MSTPKSITLQSDCMDFLRSAADNSFDLAIVDPPYGINAAKMQMGSAPNRNEAGQYPNTSVAVRLRKGRLNSGGGHFAGRNLTTMDCSWDESTPPPEYFEQLRRVSRNQIIFGGNYFALPPTRCIVCWDKVQPWDNFSQWEMAWTSFDMPAKMIRLSNRGGANDENKIHPTQKPVALYRKLLNTFAQSGDTILDTHLGSGSSRIAAYGMGFDFYGFEINAQYFTAQEERFKLFASQKTFNFPTE